jgi:transcriptional activator for dhaKLM operon
LDIALAVSIPQNTSELVESGRLSSPLAQWLGDRTIAIPPLSQRTEDLRALCLDRLAQIGSQLRGSPIGIEDGALALILAHSWPGNDVELDDVLLRAALLAKGTRISLSELESLGFLN